jgi:FtsP/CotA-like multicopper oxidase with cupredoxin domain
MDGAGRLDGPTRRAFLGSLGVLGLGVLAARSTPARAGIFDPGAGPATATMPTLATVGSRNGVLSVRLVAGPNRGTGSSLGYNGDSPGPTLLARPGDELRIHLVNRLDQPTNLHTHGLLVSPSGRSDNPFLRVEPGGEFHYRIRIPHDHPRGTYWYHPHHHGHVADQVGGGLLGALLIRGHDEPLVPDLTERLFVFSETDRGPDGAHLSPGHMSHMMGRRSGALRVNGALAPTVNVELGRAQRWRVVNACPSRTLLLSLVGHDMSRISVDGYDLPAARTDATAIPAGGRADFLVVPRTEGRFPLLCAQDVDTDDGPLSDLLGQEPSGLVAATVAVGRAVNGKASPAARFTPGTTSRSPSRPTVQRDLRLDMLMGDDGMQFAIDGRAFDPQRTDIRARRGSVEEWTVKNPGRMEHPFHLHGRPFTVLASSAGEQPFGVPQDVVTVPGDGWVRFRVDFEDYVGRSVYHCHVLDHSDAGMMGVLLVS